MVDEISETPSGAQGQFVKLKGVFCKTDKDLRKKKKI